MPNNTEGDYNVGGLRPFFPLKKDLAGFLLTNAHLVFCLRQFSFLAVFYYKKSSVHQLQAHYFDITG